MARFNPETAVAARRYILVPCEAEGSTDLAVIWDRLEEQVVEVIKTGGARYGYEDALWDEYRHGFEAEETVMPLAA